MILHSARRKSQHGLSLVELLVGVTVGLFIVSGAAMLTATQLTDNRRLLLETQLQQDLRAAADMITRDFRRSGFYTGSEQFVWTSTRSAFPKGSIESWSAVTASTGDSAEIDYRYERAVMETSFGFLRDSSASSMRSKLAGGREEDLTDPKTMNITAFNVARVPLPATQIECPKLCADGTKSCWPVLKVRAYVLTLQGQSRADPSIRRTLRTEVRLRNDYLQINPVLAGDLCPA